MASFPAVYRARISQINGSSIQAYVPQVFGETLVAITTYMGDQPALPGMGWVMFQGGNPEFPVWMGVAAGGEGGAGVFVTRDYRWVNQTTATDPTSGRIKVNQLDPALATELYLSSYDLEGTAYITALSLQPGDLIAVYLSGNVGTRIEYTISAPLTNNNGWLTFPVTVAANYGFQSGVPQNNAAVKVTVQTTGEAAPVQPMPGGVAGQVILKQSTAAGDAIWTTTVPALTITTLTAPTVNATTLNATTLNTTNATLTGALSSPLLQATSLTGLALNTANPAIVAGSLTGLNTAYNFGGLQARNNGVATTFVINPLGGVVSLGATAPVTVSSGLMTFPAAQENIRMAAAAGYQSWYSGASRIGYLQGNATQIYLNAELAGASLRLRGVAGLFLDNGTANYQLSESIIGTRVVATNANGYIFGNYFNMTANDVAGWPDRYAGMAGSDNYLRWYQNVHSSHIRGGDMSIGGIVTSAEHRFSQVGYVLRHNTDTDTGVYYWSDGAVGLIGNGNTCIRTAGTGLDILAMNPGSQFRLAGPSDGNHGIEFSNGTPSGSGEASNGPLYRAWSGHWWYQNGTGHNMYFASSGNLFLGSGRSFTNFSSIEFKEHVATLDPDECLDQVRRWRPVEYDIKSDPEFPDNPPCHSEGFISEEHVHVTPAMVNVCDENSERPGWANAISYAGGVPRLAGAVQALLARIERLEGALP